MSLRMLRTLLAVALAAPLFLQAHDASKHKGQGIRGEVVSVAGDRLELKTAAGVKTVILNDKTKLERGDQAARASDLKKGDPVMVFGTTLATGELVAKEILIQPGGHQAHKK
ncbi:MAG: hypothetical protein HY238_11990 [Acidobacteria bacterium]|nr:hypothetical protein [Acidobacteriota bacterium]